MCLRRVATPKIQGKESLVFKKRSKKITSRLTALKKAALNIGS
jgi:hypothetical protein